tara:strand:- start:800 stop:1708 length:909 start_codon:yes stop_codon:yes gene_type:complete
MNDNQGWINVYKPLNISSFGVIKKIKKKFNFNKIGHAGTLDPQAEGILPIAIGKTTKLISFISNQLKEYEFEIKWGESTTTDDREGRIIEKSSYFPSYEEINNKLKKFKGVISQKPPKASAVKIKGVRSYKLFNSDINFETIPRKVILHDSKIISYKDNEFTKLFIRCGKGFYVRSFVRDLAESLGTKGHVFSLKRTKVGKFKTNNAILLDDLLKIGQTQLGFKEIHSSVSMLDDILAYEIDNEVLIREISHGKSVEINRENFPVSSLNLNENLEVFLTFKNSLISFGIFDGRLFKPKKVLI